MPGDGEGLESVVSVLAEGVVSICVDSVEGSERFRFEIRYNGAGVISRWGGEAVHATLLPMLIAFGRGCIARFGWHFSQNRFTRHIIVY